MPDQPIDPERQRDGNAFDQPTGYSGQDYRVDREVAEGRRAADPTFEPNPDEQRDLPPDNGQRASVDPRTGEVHGAGAGAGGGNPGEDLDSSSASGDAFPLTGGESTDKTPVDLGPKSDNASYL